MENLIEMFKELPTLIQIFWVCAVASSLFMMGQLMLSLIGMGDMDADFGDSIDGMDASGGMDLFTVKNITNFFVGFGWGGISFAPSIETQWLLLLIAVVCGCLFVVIFIFLFKQLMKIQSNSAVGIEASVEQIADVYLRRPASRSGKGKIQICIQGAAREINAVTDDLDEILTGSTVKVLDTVGEDTVVVTQKY